MIIAGIIFVAVMCGITMSCLVYGSKYDEACTKWDREWYKERYGRYPTEAEENGQERDFVKRWKRK